MLFATAGAARAWRGAKEAQEQGERSNEPMQIIDEGIVCLHALRNHGVTKEQLYDMLRSKGLRTAEQVDCAFLDPFGQITVIEKSEKRP